MQRESSVNSGLHYPSPSAAGPRRGQLPHLNQRPHHAPPHLEHCLRAPPGALLSVEDSLRQPPASKVLLALARSSAPSKYFLANFSKRPTRCCGQADLRRTCAGSREAVPRAFAGGKVSRERAALDYCWEDP